MGDGAKTLLAAPAGPLQNSCGRGGPAAASSAQAWLSRHSGCMIGLVAILAALHARDTGATCAGTNLGQLLLAAVATCIALAFGRSAAASPRNAACGQAQRDEVAASRSPSPEAAKPEVVSGQACAGEGAGAGGERREPAVVCAICLEDFDATVKTVMLPCGHVFHPGCADEWLRRSRRCPFRCEGTCPPSAPAAGEAEPATPATAAAAAAGDGLRRRPKFDAESYVLSHRRRSAAAIALGPDVATGRAGR